MTKHIFISYNRAEPTTQVAKQLFRRIKVNTRASDFAEPFFDISSVPFGDFWKQEIDQALAQTTHFIALLSDGYWLSDNCQYELQEAVRLYEQHGTPRLLFVLTEKMDPNALEIEPNSRSATLNTRFPKVERLGQINFLGPYDRAGRLSRLDCDNQARLSDQLFDLVQNIKALP